jgi:hypothetical protein
MEMPSGVGRARRIDLLRLSAEIMIAVMPEGDGVGIVAFDHRAHDVEPTPLGPLGPAGAADPTRDRLRSSIDNLVVHPTGATAIGEGLERAQQRLNPFGGYDRKSIVVLTASCETAGKHVGNVAGTIAERVFAVGLGRAENIQPTALTALANGTGGFALLSGELDSDSRYKFAKCVLQVLAGVKNEEVAASADGRLGPGQMHEVPFDLADTDISAGVILMRPGPGLIDMVLVAPDGTEIDPAAAAVPGGLYFNGRDVAYYRLTLPAAVGPGAHEGRWRARLRPSRQPDGENLDGKAGRDLPYSLVAHTYSNLRMTAILAQSGFAPGIPFTLRVVLTENGLPVSRRATVAARVTDPGGIETTVAMAVAGPGVFEATIPSPLAGTYDVRLIARGRTLRGHEFAREAIRTGAVWIGGDQPAPGDGSSRPSPLRLRSWPELGWALPAACLLFALLALLILLIAMAYVRGVGPG